MTDRRCPEGGICNHEWHEHCPNEFINPCENQCELCKEETINREATPMTDKMTIEQTIKVLKSLEPQLAFVQFSKALGVAIEALGKQIPKKPILGGEYTIDEWECPNCKSYFAKLNDRPRHCCECGQLIEWRDEDCEECIHFGDDTDKCLSCGIYDDWFVKRESDTECCVE